MTKQSDLRPMLFIAMGLVVALVATDFLDLSRRETERGRDLIGPK